MEQTVELSVFSMSSRLCGVTVKTRVRGTRWSLNIFQKSGGQRQTFETPFGQQLLECKMSEQDESG